MSGSDKPPKAAYNAWAQGSGVTIPWESLTTVQQALWMAVAQAAINANAP